MVMACKANFGKFTLAVSLLPIQTSDRKNAVSVQISLIGQLVNLTTINFQLTNSWYSCYNFT